MAISLVYPQISGWSSLKEMCNSVDLEVHHTPGLSALDPAGIFYHKFYFRNIGKQLIRIDSEGQTYYLEPNETANFGTKSDVFPTVTRLNNGI